MPHTSPPHSGKELSPVYQIFDFRSKHLDYWNKSPHSGGRFRGGITQNIWITGTSLPTPGGDLEGA
jgi:hypothetical protein